MADPANTGIYEIVNLVNGKRYIGSAKSFRNRWCEHRRQLAGSQHHSRYLQRAWDKYGSGNFEFRIIELCAAHVLIEREQAAFDSFLPEYNVSRVAGSSLGVKYTDEARARVSAALKGKLKGRKRSRAAVELTAAAHRGRKRSEATRAKISAKAIGRKRSRESVEAGAAKRRGIKRPLDETRYLLGNKHASGHKHTEEWKRANSERMKGVRRPKSVEQRAKISATLKARWRAMHPPPEAQQDLFNA